MTVRATTALFAVVCAGGSAAAVALAVTEARSTDPVVARVLSTARSGTTTTARLEVRSTASSPQCVRLRVVARDRNGRDLGSSGTSVIRLAAQAKRDVRADFTLTTRQYDERLATVRAVLDACG